MVNPLFNIKPISRIEIKIKNVKRLVKNMRHSLLPNVRMEVNSMKELDKKNYNNFLHTTENATIFHSYEWYKFIKKCFDFEIYILTATDKNGNYLAALPLAHVKNFLNQKLYSFPLSPYSGFIGEKRFFESLFKESILLKEDLNCKCIVIAQSPFSKVNGKIHGEIKESKWLSQYIIVKNPQSMWMEFRPRVRKTINKAIKKGVVINELNLNSKYKVRKVYDLLLNLSKRRRFLILSYRNCLEMWKTFNSSGYLRIIIAEKDGEVIGFISFLTFKDIIFCKEGALNDEGRKLGAHSLIIWEFLKWSYEAGYKIFDFGPSSPLHENEKIMEEFRGIVKFKSSFGSLPVKFSYYNYPSNCPCLIDSGNSIWKIGRKIIQYTPSKIMSLFGTFLIKEFM